VTIYTVKVGVAHCVTPHRQDASCWIFAEAIAGFTVHAHRCDPKIRDHGPQSIQILQTYNY